jgi:hypothetical protein
MHDTILVYADAAMSVSPFEPIGLGISACLLLFAVILVFWQIWALARCSDLLSDRLPYPGKLYQPVVNLRAICRCFRDLVSVLLLVRPARVAFRFLKTALNSNSNVSLNWYIDQVIDPQSQMGYLEKDRRKKDFRRQFVYPFVTFGFLAAIMGIYLWHGHLGDGWLRAIWAAGWLSLFGFAAQWVHHWVGPVYVFLQSLKVTYVWGHGDLPSSLAQIKAPLHEYLDKALPGWSGTCALPAGIEDPSINCVFVTEVYALFLVAGFWMVNLLILFCFYMWSKVQGFLG